MQRPKGRGFNHISDIKMKNSKAKNPILLASLVGILILFLLPSFFQPKKISACDLNNPNKTKEKDYVLIQGIITKERNLTESFKLLTIEGQNCKAEVTCNCKSSLLNENVSVIGKVQLYENKTQINADKIVKN